MNRIGFPNQLICLATVSSFPLILFVKASLMHLQLTSTKQFQKIERKYVVIFGYINPILHEQQIEVFCYNEVTPRNPILHKR